MGRTPVATITTSAWYVSAPAAVQQSSPHERSTPAMQRVGHDPHARLLQIRAEQPGRLLVEHPRQDAALELDHGDGGAAPMRRPGGLQRDEPGAEDEETDAGVAGLDRAAATSSSVQKPWTPGPVQPLDGRSGRVRPGRDEEAVEGEDATAGEHDFMPGGVDPLDGLAEHGLGAQLLRSSPPAG